MDTATLCKRDSSTQERSRGAEPIQLRVRTPHAPAPCTRKRCDPRGRAGGSGRVARPRDRAQTCPHLVRPGTGVGEIADAVTISTTARARQALDATAPGLRRRGSLLAPFDKVTGPLAFGWQSHRRHRPRGRRRRGGAETRAELRCGDRSVRSYACGEPLGSTAAVPATAGASPGDGAAAPGALGDAARRTR